MKKDKEKMSITGSKADSNTKKEKITETTPRDLKENAEISEITTKITEITGKNSEKRYTDETRYLSFSRPTAK